MLVEVVSAGRATSCTSWHRAGAVASGRDPTADADSVRSADGDSTSDAVGAEGATRRRLRRGLATTTNERADTAEQGTTGATSKEPTSDSAEH